MSVPHVPGVRGGRRSSLRFAVLLAAVLGTGSAGRPAVAESALDTATALRAAGKPDEALDVLREESRELKKKQGDDSPSLLPLNDLAADILIDTGELETARTLLGKTIAARQKLIVDGKRDQASALGASFLALTRLESTAKRVPESIAAARQAIVVFDGAPERDDATVARAAETLSDAVGTLDTLLGARAEETRRARADAATTFASLGMFSEAIDQRRQILAGVLAGDEAAGGDVRNATDQLARVMMVAGRAIEALPIVEASLDAIGPDHPQDTIALRRLLGEAQLASDRLVLAEGSFARVLEATQAERKTSPVVVAADRLRCLLVALRRGLVERLPEWFGQEVKVVFRPPVEERAEGLAGLILAGEVHDAVKQPQATVEVLGRAVEIARSAKAPDAVWVADLSGRLAAAHLAAGNVAAARKTLDQALPEAVQAVGAGDARVGCLRILLADVLDRQGARDKAVAAAAEALVRGLPRPDEAWEESATTLYDRLAATDGHGDLRERFLAARARQFGADHPHVASACGLFGAARLAAGDWQAAVDFFTRAADIQRSSLGDAHPEVAASTVLLAHAERAAGDPKRAVETAARGLAIWERVAGADHPGTLSAVDVLVAAKLDAADTAGVAELLERLCAAAGDDPARRAAHLVRLADITAPRDTQKARNLLEQAMQLPCWDAPAIGQNLRWRLALTAALAAHASQAAGDAAGATAALQQARKLALQESDDPKALLDRVDAIAARGDRPTGRP